MDWKHEREAGFEQQFAHREEEAFRAAAHRNSQLAHWAARKMGLRHRDTERYVQALVTGDVAHLRGRGIIERIFEDLRAAGVAISERDVQVEFDRLDAEARTTLKRA